MALYGPYDMWYCTPGTINRRFTISNLSKMGGEPIMISLHRMATLLPWNFFITPFAYWMTKLQRSDRQNHTTTVPMLTTTTAPITNVSVQVNASISGKGTFQSHRRAPRTGLSGNFILKHPKRNSNVATGFKSR